MSSVYGKKKEFRNADLIMLFRNSLFKVISSRKMIFSAVLLN